MSLNQPVKSSAKQTLEEQSNHATGDRDTDASTANPQKRQTTTTSPPPSSTTGDLLMDLLAAEFSEPSPSAGLGHSAAVAALSASSSAAVAARPVAAQLATV